MNNGAQHQLADNRARALLVVALALLLFGARAEAGCGDHVAVNPPAGHSARGSLADHADQPAAPAPCRGPACSRHDPAPAVPPGAAHRAGPQDDLQPVALLAPARPARSLDRLASPVVCLSPPPVRSVYHPPR